MYVSRACVYQTAAFHLCVKSSVRRTDKGKLNNTFEFHGAVNKSGLHLGAFGDICLHEPARAVEFLNLGEST